MGASASHQSCAAGVGLGVVRGGVGVDRRPHPKHSRANLGATQSAEDLLSANLRVEEKKKKRSGLSTLKRKLVGKKRNWRASDHARHFKEHFSNKPPSLLSSLLEHYEVLLAMRDLKIQADLARPPASTLQQNLEALYTQGHCPDFSLVYQGTKFPTHKSILLARSPYFRNLLLALGSFTTELTVRLATPGVDTDMFSSLLRFLYTGEYPSEEMSPRQIDLLISLGRECGVPNLLEADLEHLYQSGDHTDCLLVFTADKNSAHTPDPVQLSCHKAILCARSPFFRNLVSRRLVAQVSERQERACSSLPQPLKIVLDESVIPQKYARVLVRALYVDSIDFDLVDDKSEMSDRVKDAMELYQIGRFLDLDILSQNCEDAIVQRLNQTNIADVLDWSGQPYGSPWVNRQAHQFLLDDFAHLPLSCGLEKLSKETLRSVITSDYVQASESEILSVVIKWGEMTVARRGELGDHITLPQPGRRAARRRGEGVCDREVAEAVCDLVGCVRFEHLLSAGGGEDILKQAGERGILSNRGCLTTGGLEVEQAAWDPRIMRPAYVKPRLFLPYYEACKTLLSENSAGAAGDASSFNFHRISEIPDTLYMLRDDHLAGGLVERSSSRDPLPDQDNVSQMVRRVRKLFKSIPVKRALASPFTNRQQILLQLQLR